MTILAPAIVLLMPLCQKPASLYDSLVVTPNPRNGYQDYLKAADIVNDGLADLYGSDSTGKSDSAVRAQMRGRLKELDYLEIRREMAKKYQPPSKQALRAAREIERKIGAIQEEGRKLAHHFAAGDSWGPSVDDLRSGDELVTEKIARIIDRCMQARAPVTKRKAKRSKHV